MVIPKKIKSKRLKVAKQKYYTVTAFEHWKIGLTNTEPLRVLIKKARMRK